MQLIRLKCPIFGLYCKKNYYNFFLMNIFYRLLTLGLLVVCFTVVSAQKKDMPVRFVNGNFITGNNIESQTFKKESIGSSLFDNKYYLLVQFGKLPSVAMRQKLKASGVNLYIYLPDQTYLCTINSSFDFSKAKNFNIVSINTLPAFYKINNEINNFKASADKTQEQAIAINYFENLDKSTVTTALKKAGAFVLNRKSLAEGMVLIEYNKAIIDSIAALPFIISMEMQLLEDQLLNDTSRAAHAVTGLNALVGKNLNGKGVTIGVGDDADISTHIDFAGRLISRTPGPPSNHGTHTSGTSAGAGIINPKYRGMASKATIINQYFSDIIFNAAAYITDYNMVATNNSYHTANDGCAGERVYNSLSRYADAQMYSNDKLQHVFASGNDGAQTCSPYPTSFGTVKSGWQCSKNILTVGALNVTNNTIASFSGRGPTQDGRLKPEITADGVSVRSSISFNRYGYNSGTSMACPAVTGSVALMYERYRQTHAGLDPKSALIKAIACNTTEDLGNAGPDYTYGFGMLNTRRAVEAIDSNRYVVTTVAGENGNTHNITVPANTRQLKVMLYWNDVAASSSASPSLVNDLDLTVVEPSTALRRPLILNSASGSVNNVAVEGSDHINNIEQIVINNPVAGIYTASVYGFSVPSGTQEYAFTYEIVKNGVTVESPTGGETFVPGETELIRWNAYGNDANTFTIEYSLNNGGNWILIDNNVSATARIYSWVVPSAATNTALVRISRNGSSYTDQSNYNFTILGQSTITATNVCEGAVQLDWSAVTSATSYDVLQLIGDSMKVIGNTSALTYLVTGLNKNLTYWFGVAAKNNTVSGRRSVSVSTRPSSGSCTLAAFNNDVRVDSILEPNSARDFFSNISNATKPVKVTIRNLGTTAVTGPYNVSFNYNNSAPVTEVVNTTIAAGSSITYTFTGMYTFPPAAGYNYNFKAWITKSSDNNHLNDTAYKNVKYINNDAIASLPLTENFESMPAAEFTKAEMAIGGNKYLDFNSNSTSGRARTFVNTGFALGGTKALTLDQSPYNGTSSTTDSATFSYNLSLFTTKQVRFDFYYRNHGQANAAGNKVWMKGSESNSWVQAYDLFDNQGDLGEWKKVSLNINDVLGNAAPAQNMSQTFQIKIGQEGYTSANTINPTYDIDDGYTFDNLTLTEALNDVGLLAINSPNSAGCGLGAANPVSIKIKNYNNAVLNNVQVNYKVNNGAVITETIPSIAANQTIDYVFTQTANLSAYIDYNINVWIKYNTDNYSSNDSILNYFIHNSPVVSTYPYLQDFENTDGGFYTTGRNVTWAWGTPAGVSISKAPNGTKIWGTNLTGNYSDNEASYLVTPCFNLSGLVRPVLSFSFFHEVEVDYDYAWVEYSTDGKTWNKLGNSNEGTNWYNDASTNSWNGTSEIWQVASIDIPVTNTTVRFRFVLNTDGGVTEEGLGIDDVRVHEKQEIAGSPLPVFPDEHVGPWNGWLSFDYGDAVMGPWWILGELNFNGQNLDTVTITPYSSTVNSSNNEYYLGKSFVVSSSRVPSSPVAVRLYFSDAQFRELLNDANCGTCTKPLDAYELGVVNYRGPASELDGTLSNNTDGYYTFISPDNVKIIPHNGGYYAEFNTSNFGEFWFSKGNIAPPYASSCQSGLITFDAPTGASTYQWQLNTGSGYNNITDGATYSGTTSASLLVFNMPTSSTGNKYRCLVNGSAGTEYTLRFKTLWTGTSNTNWFNAANWECGVVPDQYTDVIIPSGLTNYPVLTVDASVRSIRVLNNAPVTINTGIKLTVTGK